jgi:hypothetical protein
MPAAIKRRGTVDFFINSTITLRERVVNGWIFRGLDPLFNPKNGCQGGFGSFSQIGENDWI